MKIILSFLFLFLFRFVSSAQPDYKNLAFDEALRLAKANSKMVFMQFESSDCEECNEVADKGLSDKELSARINETFIPIKINSKHPDRDDIALQYNISPTGFGSLFIDMNGALILKYPKTISMSGEYFNQIDIALYALSESARINYLEKEYEAGNRSIDFLEVLLTKKSSLKLSTDKLLDEYVHLLPPDSLSSIRTLVFIAQLAPMFGSKAYSTLYRDPQLFNHAWYSMSNSVRININNTIIYKGVKKAISEKSEASALTIANFARNVYGTNINGGLMAYERAMVSFYEKVDTAKYFLKAIEYYNKYFMTINTDSINRIDSIKQQKVFAEAVMRDSIINGKRTKVNISSYMPISQYYGDRLNSAAWNFYKMTNDPHLLAIATNWAQRAMELFNKAGIMDTYARLLYKQGQKQKAIEVQTRARDLWVARKFSPRQYDIVLDKMKRNVALD